MSTTIVYGPPACGKTTNSMRLAKSLGAKTVIDGFSPTNNRLLQFRTDNGKTITVDEIQKLAGAGVLILTNFDEKTTRRFATKIGARVMSYSQAIARCSVRSI